MSRLSIELTSEQHQRLKAVAALQGKTIKQYVLERTLPDMESQDEWTALQKLEDYLEPRISAARRGELSSRTPEQIFESVKDNLK